MCINNYLADNDVCEKLILKKIPKGQYIDKVMK
jgi:hypothetical protein